MANSEFANGFLIELLWVLLILGGPILLAVVWQHYKSVKSRKNAARYIQIAAEQGLIDRRCHPNRSNVIPFIPNQRAKDQHIFDVVEEYRNESR